MIDIVRTRRSIRKYEKRPIDPQSVELMKEALLRCPSSRGRNPWTFIFVDNRDTLARLSETREGGRFLKDAALGIVVCGDESASDVWIEDCSIAAIVVQLTAHSLGLGSCWIQIRNRSHSAEKTAEEHVRETLGIPDAIRVGCIVSIGRPAETKARRTAGELDYRKIHYNRYRGNAA
jgi:nitroreductase